MLDSKPSIIKAGTDSYKWMKHGCDIFFMCKTQMMITGTEIPSPADNIFGSILMIPISKNIKLQVMIVIYVRVYELF